MSLKNLSVKNKIPNKYKVIFSNKKVNQIYKKFENSFKINENKFNQAKQKEATLGYFVEDGKYWEKSDSFNTDEIDSLDFLWKETVSVN